MEAWISDWWQILSISRASDDLLFCKTRLMPSFLDGITGDCHLGTWTWDKWQDLEELIKLIQRLHYQVLSCVG